MRKVLDILSVASGILLLYWLFTEVKKSIDKKRELAEKLKNNPVPINIENKLGIETLQDGTEISIPRPAAPEKSIVPRTFEDLVNSEISKYFTFELNNSNSSFSQTKEAQELAKLPINGIINNPNNKKAYPIVRFFEQKMIGKTAESEIEFRNLFTAFIQRLNIPYTPFRQLI